MNGAEAIKKIRATLGRNIPGIVVTGDTRPGTMKSIAVAGIGLCVKPVQAEIFLGEIRRLLAEGVIEHQ
jgi:CheY-like chemotaxis protein